MYQLSAGNTHSHLFEACSRLGLQLLVGSIVHLARAFQSCDVFGTNFSLLSVAEILHIGILIPDITQSKCCCSFFSRDLWLPTGGGQVNNETKAHLIGLCI